MVLDIDMTDYDDVRTCCEGAKVCEKCWCYLATAIEILDEALREDFGMNNLFWVFSGRRGVHCWISDEEARTMSNEMRSSVTDYFYLQAGNELSGARIKLGNQIHPSLQRAIKMIKTKFEKVVIKGQRILEYTKHQEKFLGFIKNEGNPKLLTSKKIVERKLKKPWMKKTLVMKNGLNFTKF